MIYMRIEIYLFFHFGLTDSCVLLCRACYVAEFLLRRLHFSLSQKDTDCELWYDLRTYEALMQNAEVLPQTKYIVNPIFHRRQRRRPSTSGRTRWAPRGKHAIWHVLLCCHDVIGAYHNENYIVLPRTTQKKKKKSGLSMW